MAVKHCVICGKEFIDYGRGKYCKGPHYATCQVCGKDFEYNPRFGKPSTCSHMCGGKLARKKTQYQIKQCVKCGKSFQPTSSRQQYCSNDCKTTS